jgi:GNAT superfamily N-acetyltransferase
MAPLMHLQPCAPTDAAQRGRFLTAFNRIWPEFAATEAEFLHEVEHGGDAAFWIAVDASTGRDVVVVQVERIRWNDLSEPPMAFLLLDVERRSPLAYEELLAPCSDFARAAGFKELRVCAWERETELVELLEGRGWAITERAIDVQLDVTAAPDDAAPLPVGIQLTTLAERPELAHAVWEVLSMSVADIPGDAPEVVLPFEEWELERRGPLHRDDTLFIALIDGAVAGFTELEFQELVMRSGVAWHGFTAVHPAFRGRGVAHAVKRASIAWARTHGIRYLRTENEERNAPMRHINARLGYLPVPGRVILRGPIDVLAPCNALPHGAHHATLDE